MKQILTTLSIFALSSLLLTSCGKADVEDPTPVATTHTVKLVAEADQPFSSPVTVPSLTKVTYELPGKTSIAAIPAGSSLRWEGEQAQVADISLVTLTAQSIGATRLTLSIYVDGQFKGQKVNSAPTQGMDEQYRMAKIQWSEKDGLLP